MEYIITQQISWLRSACAGPAQSRNLLFDWYTPQTVPLNTQDKEKLFYVILQRLQITKTGIQINVCILDFLIQNEWVKKWMNETETVYIGKMPRRSNLWMAEFIAAQKWELEKGLREYPKHQLLLTICTTALLLWILGSFWPCKYILARSITLFRYLEGEAKKKDWRTLWVKKNYYLFVYVATFLKNWLTNWNFHWFYELIIEFCCFCGIYFLD